MQSREDAKKIISALSSPDRPTCYILNMETEEFYLAKVKKDPLALRFVPEEMKTEAVCLAAVQQDKNAIKYVPKHLKDRILF